MLALPGDDVLVPNVVRLEPPDISQRHSHSETVQEVLDSRDPPHMQALAAPSFPSSRSEQPHRGVAVTSVAALLALPTARVATPTDAYRGVAAPP